MSCKARARSAFFRIPAEFQRNQVILFVVAFDLVRKSVLDEAFYLEAVGIAARRVSRWFSKSS
jgi:hypothetical protein